MAETQLWSPTVGPLDLGSWMSLQPDDDLCWWMTYYHVSNDKNDYASSYYDGSAEPKIAAWGDHWLEVIDEQ